MIHAGQKAVGGFAHRRVLPAVFLALIVIILTGCSEDEIALSALPDDAVLLAFGDSLTFGTGAKPPESYPSQLELLTGLTVINAGSPGEVSADGVRRLPRVLDRDEPDLVILCHGGNDYLRRFDEADTDVIRSEGRRERPTRGRQSSRDWRYDSYDNLDPNYYRARLGGSSSSSRESRSTAVSRPTVRSDRHVVYDEGEGGQIVPGLEVEHQQFGEGKVISVDGSGVQAKATVFFREYGQKKLVLRFARLRIID